MLLTSRITDIAQWMFSGVFRHMLTYVISGVSSFAPAKTARARRAARRGRPGAGGSMAGARRDLEPRNEELQAAMRRCFTDHLPSPAISPPLAFPSPSFPPLPFPSAHPACITNARQILEIQIKPQATTPGFHYALFCRIQDMVCNRRAMLIDLRRGILTDMAEQGGG